MILLVLLLSIHSLLWSGLSFVSVRCLAAFRPPYDFSL